MSQDLVLRWGIISAGLISKDFITAVQSLKSANHLIQAVAARSLDDAKACAEKFNIPTYYNSYDTLIEDPQVNIVYIGTLNNTHKELSLKAIHANKHVLCEKPMSLSVKDNEEVFEAARAKNVFFMEVCKKKSFQLVKLT